MSKKNFAKKFVAYTMAFAVAFGTVNVSPIFVKDAQAAEITVSSGLETVTATNDYAGTIIVGPITAKLSAADIPLSVSQIKSNFNSAVY